MLAITGLAIVVSLWVKHKDNITNPTYNTQPAG
jgi:hypothetical protein